MADAKWYIIHAYSNFEKKVSKSIMEQAEMNDLSSCFEEIQVPTEQVNKFSQGRKRTVEERWFPGYILVKMLMTDETYRLVRDIPKVSGFLGADGGKKPLPVPQEEIERIMGQASESSERRIPLVRFELGERVKVNDGPFQSFEGSVQEIDEETGRLKVTVSIFGRETPVELEYDQVEKI